MSKKIKMTLLLTAMTALYVCGAERYQNHHILEENREPARSYFMPYCAKPGDRSISLNGEWEFRWAPTPDKIEQAAWGKLRVPANWEVNGYGTPIYSSSGYTFKINPPYVMDEPKAGYTAVIERNPTGQYRRTVQIPEQWLTDGGCTYIRFDGVQSAFYVKVNGHEVGYSQGSNHPAEFLLIENGKLKTNDCADVLEPNGNSPFSILHSQLEIEVLVHKYSDGSYLEDQDAWRFGGIHRDVTLFHTPALRLRDFTVRTIATDDTYRNFRLQVHPLLQSLDSSDGADTKVVARLYDTDGKEITTMEAPALEILNLNHKAGVMNEWYPQRGYMKFERMGATINDVKPWTAETPYLYTLILSLVRNDAVIEQAAQKVGFRQVEIRNGMFLVNGIQVRFRGVNRVEHDPFTARVMSEERLLQDAMLMKAANINAVRTAHSPAHPRWYDICDSLGIYILDEADCENHGVRGEFTSTPDWNAAMMDRVIRLAERDKNHPSVVFWSLGNESGYGANHAAMAGWLHEYDPTRFVHYEGAQGQDGHDPSCVDVIARFYPRVMQDYLNPGVPEGSDKERAENARWEHLLQLAQNDDPRPVMTSEYAHCMGNALGNFQEYWDEIYSNPRMLGGFVWDWVDQGLIKTHPSNPLPLAGRRSKNTSSCENSKAIVFNNVNRKGSKAHADLPLEEGTMGGVLYGGDFGDKPNLKAFCLNGIVKCDRELTSKYYEVQHVYSPVQFARHGDEIYVINRSSHLPLTNYSAITELKCNGRTRKQKNSVLALPDIAYGDSAVIARVGDYIFPNNQDVRLNIYVTDKQTKAKVVDEQISIAGSVLDFCRMENRKCKMENSATRSNSQFSILNFPFEPSFFRAPTDNDKSFGNWLAKDWTKNRLDSAEVVTIDDHTSEYRFAAGSIVVATEMTPVQGGMEVDMTFECKGELPELPRLGVHVILPREYEKLEYYGRGPWDNYPDRWRSCHVGLWQSTVTDQYAHFPVPQDCGNHGESAYVRLTNSKTKRSITITAIDQPFSFSALHFLPQEIASYRHDYELMRDAEAGIVGNHTVLTIDCAVLGIGNSSCGPGVLKKYSIDKTRQHRLRFIVKE